MSENIAGAAIVLFCNDISVYAASVKIALNYKGIPYQTQLPPGGYGSAEYKQIITTGKIPAIVHNDFVLSESAVILEYLEETFPTPSLLRIDSPRINATIRYAQRIHDLYLEPAVRALFAHMSPATRDMAFVADKFAYIHTQLMDLERNCSKSGPFYAGEGLSFTDCILPCTLALADLMHEEVFDGRAIDFNPFPKLQSVRASYSTHSAIAPVLSLTISQDEAWLASKRL